MKKCISFVLSAAVVISCFTGVLSASAEKSIDKAEQNSISVVVENDKNSYLEYISKYSDIKGTTNDVRIELGGVKLNKKPIDFDIEVKESGLYTIGMSYKCLDEGTDNPTFALLVDGEYPYSQAEKFQVSRMWCDEAGENRVDSLGNEFAAQQVKYEDFYFNTAIDQTLQNGYEYYVYLSKGTHKITLRGVDCDLSLEYFEFGATKQLEVYKQPTDTSKFYKGEPIIIEGEDAAIKSSYFLVSKSDSSTVKVTPNDAKRNVINYIGGGNWKTIGDTIVWNTPELEEGYYCLGFSFRQNAVIGSKTYRSLAIDGKTPFAEAEKIGFTYNDNWQNSVFSDEKNSPYVIYLPKGSHEIALTVVAGDIAEVREALTEAVASLGELYIDITMITGETVDPYRDYDLFSQITDMDKRLEDIRDKLNSSAQRLLEITGQDSGSNYSVIKNMVEVINQMFKNKFEAHKYKSTYYSNYCSVSSVLQDLRNMPLDIDSISLFAPEGEPYEKIGLFEQLSFSVQRFFVSFIRDYNGISNEEDQEALTLWVNWGRDQAQVLTSLIDRTFTQQTGIKVNIQLVNASIVQAVLSGNGPDCILQHSRSEPVNLAMRGVLYDLTQFEDCDEVLKRFQKGAETPYRYKDGLYALPDTQIFFMMFCRNDILAQFGIKAPETWDDFNEAAKILMRNNMSIWLPNNPATSAAQINSGVGGVNIFPSLLMQRGYSIYSEDGKSTNLLSPGVMQVFSDWTEYYTSQKFPVSIDFYNRFRVGTTPIGISTYTLYNTLKVAAPEIDGLWSMTYIPGTVREDGTISHVSAGGGTSCAILKNTKNPEKAWELLKWWTSKDTQLTYSNDVESMLGPVAREPVANVEALKELSWDEGTLEEILSAWEQVKEVPEYPGSYYVTRSIYQSFWNVVNSNKNTKDMLMQFGKEANDEIALKWQQYSNRGN